MEYIEVKIGKGVFILTPKELKQMLHHQDHDQIYKDSIRRGKAFKRAKQQAEREAIKRDEFNPNPKSNQG